MFVAMKIPACLGVAAAFTTVSLQPSKICNKNIVLPIFPSNNNVSVTHLDRGVRSGCSEPQLTSTTVTLADCWSPL